MLRGSENCRVGRLGLRKRHTRSIARSAFDVHLVTQHRSDGMKGKLVPPNESLRVCFGESEALVSPRCAVHVFCDSGDDWLGVLAREAGGSCHLSCFFDLFFGKTS